MKVKRLCSIALCLAMLATMLPAPALAAGWQSDADLAAYYDAATGRLKRVADGMDETAFDGLTADTEVKLFRLDDSFAPRGEAYRVLVTTGSEARLSGTYDMIYAKSPVTLRGTFTVRDRLAGAKITIPTGSSLSTRQHDALRAECELALLGELSIVADSAFRIVERSDQGEITRAHPMTVAGTVYAWGGFDAGDWNENLLCDAAHSGRIYQLSSYFELARMLSEKRLVTVGRNGLSSEQEASVLWASLFNGDGSPRESGDVLDGIAMLIASGALDPNAVEDCHACFTKEGLEFILSKVAEKVLTDRHEPNYSYADDGDAASLKSFIAGIYDEHQMFEVDPRQEDGNNWYWHSEFHELMESFAGYFADTTPREPDNTTTALVLTWDEHRQPVVTYGGTARSQIENVQFTKPVTLRFDASGADAGADWLNHFRFERCDFDGGLTVVALTDKGYGVDFSDSCTGNVTTALPETVADAGAVQRSIQLNNLRGVGSVTANTRTELGGSNGWNGILTQAGEAPVTAQAVDWYSMQANWWKEDDVTQHELNVSNYVYQHDEATGQDFNRGASESVLTLGGAAAYTGELAVSGNVDFSAMTLGNEARVRVEKGRGRPSTIRFGSHTVFLDDDFDETCTLYGSGTAVLARPHNGQITLNGVTVGNAHVFNSEHPYGVYLGQRADLTGVSWAVYPGRWNGSNAVFQNAPVDASLYEEEDNGMGGVNLQLKQGADDSTWIHDAYQVKLVMTYQSAAGGTAATVVYNTLWYKEGQMGVDDFAGRVRELLGNSPAATLSEADLTAVTTGWARGDYNETAPDDFAFAVKYGGLLPASQEGDHGAAGYWVTHCRSAWDSVRYGTAKAILEGAYRAALGQPDAGLPESARLTEERTNDAGGAAETVEYEADHTLSHQDVHTLLDRFEQLLPRTDSDITRITVKSIGGKRYTLWNGAEDVEANRHGTEFHSLRFAQTLTIEVDGSAAHDELSFRNCELVEAELLAPAGGGATSHAPAFCIDFGNSCTGKLKVIGAAPDRIAREAYLNNATRWDEGTETFQALFYRDTVSIRNANRMKLKAVDGAHLGVSMDEGGGVRLNEVDYASSAAYRLSTRASTRWTWDEALNADRLVSYQERYYAYGSSYDYDNESLGRVLTVHTDAQQSPLQSDLYIIGVVDTTDLTMQDCTLFTDYEEGDLTNLYVTLGSGQKVKVGENAWRLDLFVNGEHIEERPCADWDERGVRISMSDALRTQYGAEVRQRRLNAQNELKMTNINDELVYDAESRAYRNPEDGFDAAAERWNPLNRESVYDTQVRLNVRGNWVIFDPVLRGWERPVDLCEFGSELLRKLNENGMGSSCAQYDHAFEGNGESRAPTEFYQNEMAMLSGVWPGWHWLEDTTNPEHPVGENELWRGGEHGYEERLALALVVDLLGAETVRQSYGSPDDVIRWGDAKAALSSVLQALGKQGIAFNNGGWQDDSTLNQDGKDDLMDQFCRLLSSADDAAALVAALSRNGEAVVTGEVKLNADTLAGLTETYGAVLSGSAESGYTVTVPAGGSLRIINGGKLSVGGKVTLALADGFCVGENGEALTQGNYIWQTNEDDPNDHYIAHRGARLDIDERLAAQESKLTVGEGGRLVLGRWSEVRIGDDCTLSSKGAVELAGSDFRVRGYWTNGAFAASEWDDERENDGWIDRTDAAHIDSSGFLIVRGDSGTMTLGKNAGIQNNVVIDGARIFRAPLLLREHGAITLASGACINNDGVIDLESSDAVLTLQGEDAGINNNRDDMRGTAAELRISGTLAVRDGAYLNSSASVVFTDTGRLTVRGGHLGLRDSGVVDAHITMERDASAEIFCAIPVELNGLTLAQSAPDRELGVFYSANEDGTEPALIVENRASQVLTITGSDWAGGLVLFGSVDADGVTLARNAETGQEIGYIAYKTAFVSTETELRALLDPEGFDPSMGVSDVVVTDHIALTSSLNIPESCYLEVARDASLTIPAGVTLTNAGTCRVRGQVENEGAWTQSGKLVLDGYGMFSQYLTGTLTFTGDAASDGEAIETVGDGSFYVKVREDSENDDVLQRPTGKGTIAAAPQALLDSVKAHIDRDDHIKTMALVLSADGIAAANEKQYNDCVLAREYDSDTVLNAPVAFDAVGFTGNTLVLGDNASLIADKLLGEGTITAASWEQVVCRFSDPSVFVRITAAGA